MKNLRKMFIKVLDDENGISEEAFVSMKDLASELEKNDEIADILPLVDACNGRFFLPEDHGL